MAQLGGLLTPLFYTATETGSAVYMLHRLSPCRVSILDSVDQALTQLHVYMLYFSGQLKEHFKPAPKNCGYEAKIDLENVTFTLQGGSFP